MSSAQHLRVVTGWLSDLANLTAGTAPLADAKTKIGGLASMLADDFPDPRAFSRESVRAVAEESNFFPAYGPLKRLLSAWWDKNRPAAGPALPGPDESNLAGADRSMIVFWSEYVAGTRPLPEGVTLAGWLSMCRRTCPNAYGYLARYDAKAAEITVRRRWTVPGQPRVQPTPEEEQAVHQLAEAAVQAIAATRQPASPRRMTIDDAREQSLAAAGALAKSTPSDAHQARIKAIRDADPLVARARAQQAEMARSAPPTIDAVAEPSPDSPPSDPPPGPGRRSKEADEERRRKTFAWGQAA